MKILSQIFLFFFIITQYCPAQWLWQNPLPQGNHLQSVKFISSTVGWAVGKAGTILKTINGGATWIQQSSGTSNPLYGVSFTDENNGTVVGWLGTILRTTNGGVSFVEDEEIDEIPTEFLLSQNYPNPFNPSTVFRYSIPNQSIVMIKVYDILGNEIETLVNEEKPSGIYEIIWYAESAEGGLPSGIYFYKYKQVHLFKQRRCCC